MSQKISPFLWFDNNAEEATRFYLSVFKDSKLLSSSPMGTSFEINGLRVNTLNGGPMFKFTEAISLFVDCETQDEVDYYWKKLSEGGKESRCGWLKDKYGLSWQVIPTTLGKLLNDPNPVKAKNVLNAMMQMGKIEIRKLQEAYDRE